MKKLGKKLIALVAVTVMGLSMIACGKKYKSVEAYVKSSEVQDVLKQTESAMGSGVDVDITADGDKMVYTFKYNTIELADQPDLSAQLESAMGTQDSTFQEAADDMKKLVKADKPSVVIEYVDKNDEVIFSKEYVAK